MYINKINGYRVSNIRFAQDRDVVWSSISNDDDTYQNNAREMSTKQKLKTEFELSTDTIKKNLWFSKGIFTKRNLNAFVSDPKAYLFEYISPAAGSMIDHRIIGQTQLKNRKTKEKEQLDIEKASFEFDTEIYSLNKGKEKLAFVNVDTSELGVLHINYISTLVGREDYSALFLTLMQVAVENCINNGFIPEIHAVPTQVGNKNFNRASLYSMYGAEYKIIEGEYDSIPVSVVSQDKVIKMLESIQKSPKRDFIFPYTEYNFNILKNGG
ncbi:MAG: hypothetical protein IJY61_07930 [Candidatus Gastranaerophilales bacterium]|nr:hypothetical protein [Candidatus Gastranaerophilales bacterium]